MFNEDKTRLKSLLIASTFLYAVAVTLYLTYFKPLLTSYKFIGFAVNHPWMNWALALITIMWIPVSIFLFIQGFVLINKMSKEDDLEKGLIPILSVISPLIFWGIFIISRIVN